MVLSVRTATVRGAALATLPLLLAAALAPAALASPGDDAALLTAR
ncbi:hypothetical protein [Georgenia sp. SUBG003]